MNFALGNCYALADSEWSETQSDGLNLDFDQDCNFQPNSLTLFPFQSQFYSGIPSICVWLVLQQKANDIDFPHFYPTLERLS